MAISNVINELKLSVHSNEAPLDEIKKRNNLLKQIKDISYLDDHLLTMIVEKDVQSFKNLSASNKSEAINILKNNMFVYATYTKKLESIDSELFNTILIKDTDLENGIKSVAPNNSNNQPVPSKEIDKKLIFEDIDHDIQKDGSVKYFLNKEHIFTDYGDQVILAKSSQADSEQVILAMLMLAKEKYYGKFELTGSEEFKLKALDIIVKNNLKVSIFPMKYNEILQEKLKLANEKNDLKNQEKEPDTSTFGIKKVEDNKVHDQIKADDIDSKETPQTIADIPNKFELKEKPALLQSKKKRLKP